MGYRARKDATHRISLGPFDGSDNWVDIKAVRSYGDRLKASGAAAMAAASSGGGALAVMEQRMVLFETCLVAWSLRAEDGDPQVMALTREAFTDLPEHVGDYIATEMLAHYNRRELAEDDLKNSNGPSTGP